jgi:putative ABC transport system ATP-binding protein
MSVALRQVSKVYRLRERQIPVLDAFSLQVEPGEFLALMGPSGSGKTTILNLVGGVDRPTSGEVEIFGERIDGYSEGRLTRWRADTVGFVFQFYNLMPTLSAADNVEIPLLLQTFSSKERRRRVEVALELVDLADRSRHRPAELSGGEQQRIAIARALVADPRLLLCDEPTGDLDRTAADRVLDLLKFCATELDKTVVMVTHDPEAALQATRTLTLSKVRPHLEVGR